MHTFRAASSRRLPQVYRITKSAPTLYHSTSFNMPLFFPRFQEFSPLFRMMEDFDRCTPSFQTRAFQPPFDVKELEDSYELHGEVPGYEAGDVNIEWSDGNTLSITGRTEKRSERGTTLTAAIKSSEAPKAVEEAKAPSTETEGSDAEGFEVVDSNTNSNYHKPTIEDEADEAVASAPGSSATAAAEQTTDSTVAATPKDKGLAAEVTKPRERYWVSERSVGSFSRAFSFPARIDQDAVKASLKNGILSIVVPKAQRKEPRRINIE